MPDQEQKRIVEISIGFDVDTEEISFIKSDFMDGRYGFKEPVEYTAQLLQMALEKWIREEIGMFCPECDNNIQEDWEYCPKCGWKNE